MNVKQKGIIKGLRKIAKELRKSPTRREISRHLNHKCKQHFGSFNKAKLKAGLKINKRDADRIPKRAYKRDKDLAQIVSYVTCDGHLHHDLKAFYLSSKKRKVLSEFRKLILKKFGVRGRYEDGTGYGKTEKYRICNAQLGRLLHESGTPKGDKMVTPFDVPLWIKQNNEFSRQYVKIAFFCEGSKHKASKNTETIAINLNKSVELLDDGIEFMNSLKTMLQQWNIETTKNWIQRGNIRK